MALESEGSTLFRREDRTEIQNISFDFRSACQELGYPPLPLNGCLDNTRCRAIDEGLLPLKYLRTGAFCLKTSLNAGVWAPQRPKDMGVLQGPYLELWLTLLRKRLI